jgi:cell division protein FtsL
LKKKPVRAPGKSAAEVKANKKRIKPLPIFYLMAVSVLIVISVLNYAKLNELTFEAATIKSETQLLQDDIVRLNVELNRITDISTIEEKAEELGMVKTDSNNVKYISIPSENKVESETENDSGIVASIIKSLSVIMEYFS